MKAILTSCIQDHVKEHFGDYWIVGKSMDEIAERFPTSHNYNVSIDGACFDSNQKDEINTPCQKPMWEACFPYIMRCLEHSGIEKHILEKSKDRLYKDLTTYDWLFFYHVPGINTPQKYWTPKILQQFRKHGTKDRSLKERPWENFGFATPKDGTPSGKASQTTIGNTMN